jgi:hypothetical protein
VRRTLAVAALLVLIALLLVPVSIFVSVVVTVLVVAAGQLRAAREVGSRAASAMGGRRFGAGQYEKPGGRDRQRYHQGKDHLPHYYRLLGSRILAIERVVMYRLDITARITKEWYARRSGGVNF